MPRRDSARKVISPNVHPSTWPGFYVAGSIVVLFSATLIFSIGVWTALVDPSLPLGQRCLHVVEFVFIEKAFAVFPLILFMTGGMHLIVTAFLKRHRFLFNFTCAVLLTWVVVGLLLAFFLLMQVAR